MKIRLQIGVTAIFTLVSLGLIGSIVGYLFVDQRELALKTAKDEMLEARDRSVLDIVATMNETATVVHVASSMIRKFPEQARSLEMLDVMSSLIEENDHYYGIYFGIEEGGAFYQNVQMPKGLETFGPRNSAIPEDYDRVMRVIDGSDGLKSESYFWANSSDTPVEFAKAPATFDPRTRPWYQGAIENEDVYVTPFYRFESTGRLGVTFSKVVLDDTGLVLGVAGADITMSALSHILEDIRVGEGGYVFMMNASGQLLAYTGSRNEALGTQFVPTSKSGATEIENEIVQAALSHWATQSQPYFRFFAEDQNEAFISSIGPIPSVHGIELVLGFIVPEDEFVGALKSSTLHVIQLSAVALALAVLLMAVFAHFLSKNLQRVTAEAKRIRNFDLSSDLTLRSRITEVADLSDAMSKMKTGLTSFGAYVPKDLVRSIVAKGEQVQIGGNSRPVTILFSDIEGFTSKTEGVTPEDLMPALSNYFSKMEHQITANKGIVDKYIGDAVMALWNVPELDEHHCKNACRAVLACMHAEDEINATQQSSPLNQLRTRFGLHCDTVVVGNVGSVTRMQYTALGAAVNLASRVEALSKIYGTRALVTDFVVRQVGEAFTVREIDLVAPAGTEIPIRIYELLGEEGTNCSFPTLPEIKRDAEEWDICYGLYCQRKWAEALAAFDAYSGQALNTTLVEIYCQRCREFLENPPNDNWDGVHRFTHKS